MKEDTKLMIAFCVLLFALSAGVIIILALSDAMEYYF